MAATVQNLVTSGVFELDGGSWNVDNNVWIVGDDTEVIVIDAAHDAGQIAGVIGERAVRAIVCTHAHNDHVNAAPDLAERTGAPILLHPEDRGLWDLTHPDRAPDDKLCDAQTLSIAGTELSILHTPGHAPGAVCLYAADLGAVFTGDTLFSGGPGATGRSYSDYPTIVKSIRERLFALPDDTTVYTGHGEHTTIGAEKDGSTGWPVP
ncbi:MBL fold metallo-hydrolase [Qaidamihabitans albus]|uniref:MBL fold metallo-hydrolase n=1 Tax=Qaidamihabitans albus TaxID=2795733 RepID=UPI0018F168B1|nr:MBL fold metallo-hydrolase [Qaidamihabitans albus]